MDGSIALVKFSKPSRRACVKTFEYAHIEVGLKIWFPHRFAYERDSGLYTEVQPGSFCLMDGDYLANDYDDAPFERSLAVRATVVSRPTPDRAVVDAGSKAVDLVSGAPTLAVGSFRSGGDEHGIIDGPGDLACGDHVELFPSHCDPCVNLHDYWVCHRGGVVEAVVPVDARGPGL